VFLADEGGRFIAYRLVVGGHYEVHGTPTATEETASPARPSASATISTPAGTSNFFGTRFTPGTGHAANVRVPKKSFQRLVRLISKH